MQIFGYYELYGVAAQRSRRRPRYSSSPQYSSSEMNRLKKKSLGIEYEAKDMPTTRSCAATYKTGYGSTY